MSFCASFEGAVSGDGSGAHEAPRLRIKRMLARDSSPDTFLCDAPGESVLIGCSSSSFTDDELMPHI